jgi:hypothetical protein
MAPTVWADGCRSWYIGPDGVAVQWPFARGRLREVLKAPNLSDFEMSEVPAEVAS